MPHVFSLLAGPARPHRPLYAIPVPFTLRTSVNEVQENNVLDGGRLIIPTAPEIADAGFGRKFPAVARLLLLRPIGCFPITDAHRGASKTWRRQPLFLGAFNLAEPLRSLPSVIVTPGGASRVFA